MFHLVELVELEIFGGLGTIGKMEGKTQIKNKGAIGSGDALSEMYKVHPASNRLLRCRLWQVRGYKGCFRGALIVLRFLLKNLEQGNLEAWGFTALGIWALKVVDG